MITVSVQLYGVLRDALPPENKGHTTLQLPASSTVDYLLDQLNVKKHLVLVAINETHQADHDTLLQDGNQVSLFTMIGGGSFRPH